MSQRRAGLDTEALLLRSTAYRDADRIVTLFTERLGRVTAVARSARKSQRRFGGTLEPFVRFRATLVPGGSDLYSLRQTEPVQVFSRILGGWQRVDVASAGLVLVRGLAPEEQPEPELWASLLRFLTLADLSEPFDRTTLLAFAMHLLALVGSAPALSVCGRCDARAPAGRAVTFDARSGALRCRACGGAEHRLSGQARTWLEGCHGDWVTRASAPLGADDSRASRRAIAAFLGQHVHASLASVLRDTV